MSNVDRSVRIVGPVQIAGANGMSMNMIPSRASAVVIANEVIYSQPALIYVGVGGDVAIVPWDDPNANVADPIGYVVFKGMAEGSFLPVYAKRVGDAGNGTSATDLVACF